MYLGTDKFHFLKIIYNIVNQLASTKILISKYRYFLYNIGIYISVSSEAYDDYIFATH